MKNVYEKPAIFFESFSLSTNIAGDCEVKTNLISNNSCGMEMEGYIVFMTGMAGCTDIKIGELGGDGEWSGICYHTPTGQNLFNS